MTTYTKLVYYGQPFQYKITKDRYYDLVVTKSITTDTTDNVTLEEYSGLDITNNNGIITISSGILPNGDILNETNGVYGEIGSKYLINGTIYNGIFKNHTTDIDNWNCFYNYSTKELELNKDISVATKVWIGSIVIPQHIINQFAKINFDTSGNITFSDYNITLTSGSYLTANKKLLQTTFYGCDYDFITKVTPSNQYGYGDILCCKETGNHFGLYGGAWSLYSNGTHATGGAYIANTPYWVRIKQIQDGQTLALYYMVDDGTYTTNTLPDVSNSAWIQATQITGSAYLGFASENTILIGTDNTSNTFTGKIDLQYTYLYYNISSAEEDYKMYWQALDTCEII